MEGLDEKLNALKTGLEGKSKELASAEMKAFEEKYKEQLEAKYAKTNELEAMKDELEAKMKLVQDHADKLDVKMKKNTTETKSGGYISEMQKSLEKNFEEIKNVSVGQKAKFEVKAVADMTTSNNLTGSVLETYQPGVADDPSQKVNFSDLVPTVSSGTGVYVVYRETGQEGSISAKTEGAAGTQIDFDYTKITFNAANLFGYSRVSSEMLQDLPFLQSSLPIALRREYFKVENTAFYTDLVAAATASTEVITGQNKIEMLLKEISTLEGSDWDTTGIVVTPSDYWDILVTEKSTGAGYGLPGVVTQEGGQLRVAGIPIYRANWVAANKYIVGDWNQAKKISVQGLSVEFFEQDSDNVTKDLVTARIKSRTVLGIDRPDAFIYGDFTAV